MQWTIPSQGTVVSISKDREQYDKTVKEIDAKGEGEPEDNNPFEVSIPDDCAFAKMVQVETVFLHRDEEDIITFPE